MKKNRLLLFNNKEYIIYSHILESIKSNRQGKYLRLGELTIKTETIVVKEKEIDKIVWINKQDIYRRYDGIWHPSQIPSDYDVKTHRIDAPTLLKPNNFELEYYTIRDSFYENDKKIKEAIDYFDNNNSIQGYKGNVDISFLEKKDIKIKNIFSIKNFLKRYFYK